MNVLFLSVDDLRPQLNCTDAPGTVRPPMYTPNIDELAENSLVLLRSQVAMATCSPSRTAMLTGRHVGRTHVWDLHSYFRNTTGNFTTIPQYFKDVHGYETQGMGKIFHPGVASGATGGSFPCDVCRGEDDADYSWSKPYFHGKDTLDNDYENSWLAVPENITRASPLQDTQVADQAVSTIRAYAARQIHEGIKSKPFFLAVGFHKPHLPFVFPERFLEYYPEDLIRVPENNFAPYDMPEIAWQNFGETRSYHDIAALNASGAPNTSLPDKVIKDLRRAYYASVSYTDYNIGLVLNALRESNLEKNTVVAFWGDHGWTLAEHSEFDKHTDWTIATHAPVMFRVPGVTDGGVRTFHVTETVDIFPSVVDFALGDDMIPRCGDDDGDDSLTCTDGESVRPLIANPETPLKIAALSVYNRGIPRDEDDEEEHEREIFTSEKLGASKEPKMSTCLLAEGDSNRAGCALGYTILTHIDEGHEVRYTEWVHFPGRANKFAPNWGETYAVEFYNHTESPGENVNRFRWIEGTDLHKALSERLHEKVNASIGTRDRVGKKQSVEGTR